MRCALRYDDEKLFAEQKVEAWGELQSIHEEPCYKETELNEDNSKYFIGYKVAMDDAVGNYGAMNDSEEYLSGDEECEETQEFRDCCAASIAMMLFSLLDEQGECESEDG